MAGGSDKVKRPEVLGPKMDSRVKRLWLKALRGGHYKKTDGQLRRSSDDSSPEYCCLGVLTELYRLDTGRGRWQDDDQFRWRNDTAHGELPMCVMKWAGLDSCDPVLVPKEEEEVTAAELNDNGVSFKRIAQLIERWL